MLNFSGWSSKPNSPQQFIKRIFNVGFQDSVASYDEDVPTFWGTLNHITIKLEVHVATTGLKIQWHPPMSICRVTVVLHCWSLWLEKFVFSVSSIRELHGVQRSSPHSVYFTLSGRAVGMGGWVCQQWPQIKSPYFLPGIGRKTPCR